ncbi:MAG: hypothetical protein WCP55_22600 [Lentisphaerota bacterium]
MKKKGIVFGLVMSLIAGILLGASGGIFLFPKIFPPPRPSGPNDKDLGTGPKPLPPDAVREKIMQRLEGELKLTDLQKAQVEREVKIFSDELGIFHTTNREKLMSMFDAFKTKLSGLLSEEQAARLDKISRGICNPPPPPDHRQMHDQDDRRPPKND